VAYQQTAAEDSLRCVLVNRVGLPRKGSLRDTPARRREDAHLAIALGRAVVEAGHSVVFASATALLAALSKGETDGQLSDRLMFYAKPKPLIMDEFG
jgi:IstB-like ATP binding protein